MSPLPWGGTVPAAARLAWWLLDGMRAFSRLLPIHRPCASVPSVPTPVITPSSPTPAVGAPLECVAGVPADILGGAGPVVGVDFVPTCPPPVPVSGGKGAGRWLARGQDRSRVMGWALREKVIQCHVFEGRSLRETARLCARSYKRVAAVWAAICRDAAGGKASPEERRQAVRAYLDAHYRRVMEGAQGLLGEAAAYGAVVVAAGKALAELHGLKPEEVLPAGLSLEDVGREVRVVSPLLIDRLDKVRELRGVGADPASGHAVRWAKGREVPVEGEPAGLGGNAPAAE